MALLLTESLDPARRELAHQHIESCTSCGPEWDAWKETWAVMGDLPEVEVPPSVREKFLGRAGLMEKKAEVIPFRRRPAVRWLAQAAGVLILAGGGYFAGNRTAPRLEQTPATLDSVSQVERVSNPSPLAIAETRVLDTESLSPEIQGRPNIANVQFVDSNPADDQVAVSFDVTSRWTVTGNPKDKSMVRLLSYMLENEGAVAQRSHTMDWVQRTYSDPEFADPEIAIALAKVLRNESHEGVRIRAVEALTTLPATVGSGTREALIEALRSDPNPAVRIKAVEALSNLARSGTSLDPAMVDMLRQKAGQDDENLYVRVKAAEALSNIKPQAQ